MKLNRLACTILALLHDNNAQAPLTGMSITELSEELSCNYNTLYKHMKQLENGSLVKIGLKNYKSDTYFITDLGIKTLSILKGEC